MTIFGIGPFELLIIVVIALVVVGPERLPELMFQLGQGVNKVKQVVLDLRNQARAELGDDYQSLEQFSRQIRDLNPRRQIEEFSRSLLDETPPLTTMPDPATPAPPPPGDISSLASAMLGDDLLDATVEATLAAELPPAEPTPAAIEPETVTTRQEEASDA